MTRTMAGKLVLVTGGTSGIGQETATQLARDGATVIVTGRDLERGRTAVEAIRRAAGSDAVTLMALDLERQADIRRFAADFLAAHPTLDVLINNAAAGYPKRKVTEDGIEATLATNVLGPFLLTHLLLLALRAAGQARIINVASGLHRRAVLDFDDLQGEKRYRGFPRAYAQSKLALVHTSYVLAERLAGTGITVNVADPGIATTNYARHWSVLERFFGFTILRPFQKTPAEAARSSVELARSAELGHVTGKYFGLPCKELASSPASYDREAAARVWAIAEQLTGVVGDGLADADVAHRYAGRDLDAAAVQAARA